MTRVIYVNGQYRPYDAAFIHAEDRGFQFADAVYEVCEVRDGRIVDETRHLERLARSLGELMIRRPMSQGAWQIVIRETIRRNRVSNGIVYIQVSRGAAPRDFLFPDAHTQPTVVCLARPTSRPAGARAAAAGIGVTTERDPRWNRCDIKTVMLLPASLAKERAGAAGAKEVWFTDSDGFVTEGGSSNAWIVTANDELVTTPVSNAILKGVTRTTVLDVAEREGLRLVERQFTPDEAATAREAFITSASNLVMPVTQIDGRTIGEGQPGPVAGRLLREFHEVAELAD
ncbi:MAG: D-amino-acid transaminase [Pseudomonadota bacterium]